MCMWGGCPCAVETGLDLQWPGQESLSFPWLLQALILETSHPGNLGRMHGGLGVYKYLQIFLVLVDVVEFEDVRVLDELQDGYLPLHLGEKEWRAVSLASLPVPSPRPSLCCAVGNTRYRIIWVPSARSDLLRADPPALPMC